MPQSPKMANDAVLPACKPCCSAWQKVSICRLRPINSSGLTGKFGSRSTSGLQCHKCHNCQKAFFLIFVHGWAALKGGKLARPSVQTWRELVVGLQLMGRSPSGLVRGFGNEGVVLNEGAVDYGFRPVDSELDKRKRDPPVAFLDDADLAEYDSLRS